MSGACVEGNALFFSKGGFCRASRFGMVIAVCLVFVNMSTLAMVIAADAGNQTGDEQNRHFEISVAVKDGGFLLGQVIALVDRRGKLDKVERTSFLATVKKVLRSGVLEAFDKNLPSKKHISLSEIEEAGLRVSYSAVGLEILVSPTVEQRPRGEVRGRTRSSGGSSNLSKPALFSGFLNTYAGVAYSEGERAGAGRFDVPNLRFDGAIRWAEFALEGDALVNTGGDLFLQSLRLVHDNPEYALRVTAGDVQISPDGILTAPALMGVALERNFSLLQPSSNIRPTGKRSFRVERNSDVRVIVNGHEVRRLQLPPGEYDLDDLPLTSGSNDVQVIITDEFGNAESVDFSILFNRALMKPGLSEWSIAAGKIVESNAGQKEDKLIDLDNVVVGSVRSGLSETVTTGAALHLSGGAKLAGLSSLIQSDLGLLGLGAKASLNEAGDFGWSGEVELSVDKAALWDERASFNLGIEYLSEQAIASLTGKDVGASRLRFHGSVYQPIWYDINLSLSGYYLLSSDSELTRYGASLSANRSLSQDLSVGVSASLDQSGENQNDLTLSDGVSLLARLRYQPSQNSSISYLYDAASRTSAAAFDTRYEAGSNRLAVGVETEHHPDTPTGSSENIVGANISATNSRYELNASHSRHLQGLGERQFNSRTAVNLGWSLAFADGSFAFGRPVRSAFAIVDAHDNLEEAQIKIAPRDGTFRAQVDDLGPALVPDISPYSQTNLAFDIQNAPPGYNFGTGSFGLSAAYKSGYSLKVGSDFSLSAIGILEDRRGEPLALQSGTIKSEEDQDRAIVLFTNRSGRFSIQGLKPGNWIIVMNDNEKSRYAVSVRNESSNLIQLGTLLPVSEAE